MKVSEDGITVKEIKLRAFEIAVSLVMVTSVVAFVCYWVLGLVGLDLPMRILAAGFLALSFTGYFFIKKILLAFAQDVTKRGIASDVYEARVNS